METPCRYWFRGARCAGLALLLTLLMAAPCGAAGEQDLKDMEARLGLPESAALKHLRGHARPLGLDEAVLAQLVPVRTFVTRHSGVRHVIFQQKIGALPVFNGYVQVHLTEDLEVLSVQPAGLCRRIESPAGVGLSEADAASVCANAAGEALPPEPVEAEAVLYPAAGGCVPAWRVVLPSRQGPAVHEMVVSRATGHVLFRHNRAEALAAEGCVYLENPLDPIQRIPYPDDSVLVAPESPEGWAFADVTTGNNADAYEITQTTPPYRPVADPGPPLSFCFADDLDIAINQAFYFVNFAHDYAYRLGFDEAAGNFQEQNFDLGGFGGDSCRVEIRDDPLGPPSGNAYFLSDIDGKAPRLVLETCDVDCNLALDGDVVLHEYAHGIVSRLVGGPLTVSGLTGPQGGALRQGSCDFFPTSVFDDPCLGEWYVPPSGLMCLDRITFTYADLCKTDIIVPGCEVHNDGQIWAAALWRMREVLASNHGHDEGRAVAEQLFIDGLKFSPLNPSFLDMRDAILLADRAGYGGAHWCEIWQAFAEKGMGFTATTTGPDDEAPVAVFDLPPECVDGARVFFDRPSYGCAGEAILAVMDGSLPRSLRVDVTTDSGDSENIQLPCTPGVGCVSAPVALTEASPPVPGNSVLEVAEGEQIHAVYQDPNPAQTLTDQAEIRCSAGVAVAGYRVEGDCDGDSAPGFPELPGFLDAGESADLFVRVTNLEPFDLTGVSLTLVSESPEVTVPGPGPVVIDRLPATQGTSHSERVAVFQVAAAGTVAPGTVASLRLDFSGDGYNGTIEPLRIAMPLQQSYEAAREEVLLDEDFEGASAQDWTHIPILGSDEWALVDCASHSPSHSYHVGAQDCTTSNTYQYAALLSPVLKPAGADAVSFRVKRVEFEHRLLPGTGVPQAVYLTDADYVNGQWAFLDAVSENSDFELHATDLAPADTQTFDLASGVRVAFVFYSSLMPPVYDGWYVDDVFVSADVVRVVDHAQNCKGLPNSLFMVRQGSDAYLEWGKGPTAGDHYNIHRTASKTRLFPDPAGIGAEPVVAQPDGVRSFTLAGEILDPTLHYYAVYERDPGTGESIF